MDGSNTAPSGRVDGPFPYGGATRHTNANPVQKDSQSGNLGSSPSGVAPEVISYGYGFYPLGNMDGAPSGLVDGHVPFGGDTQYPNTGLPVTNEVAPRGRVDGPFPFGGDTQYANAAPINACQTISNPGGLDDGPVPFGGVTHYSNVGYPVTNIGQTSINTADGPVPYEPTDPVVFPWAKTLFMKPNNWKPLFRGYAQWEPITETPASDKSSPLSSSYIVQSRNSYIY
ncbi:uncharacterized protein LOC117560358 isoform X1 [Gymnodraco acuticeps]|uniref:Uncharacterized protein LOC117560358 isoform X1 n=1 Tax=Gymnodraco acuticeps TaxID=8218 RepID=A0A6P8VQS2_GYMAC|nr:uncharacterized protein LOC117560358 isoform X1 [Gymnodraco acuticeps]XP_034093110.1 uncharacterized protein LOC117560358 isoform X1 [Gymnodraco acuticeps]